MTSESENLEVRLFEKVGSVQESSTQRQRDIEMIDGQELRAVADTLDGEFSEESIKALFAVMPQVKRSLANQDRVVVSPMSLDSNHFLEAISIASRATQQPIKAHCDDITTIALPEQTAEEVIEQHRQNWITQPA